MCAPVRAGGVIIVQYAACGQFMHVIGLRSDSMCEDIIAALSKITWVVCVFTCI